jgi:hypothetical protein
MSRFELTTERRNGEIIQTLVTVLAKNPSGIKSLDAIEETTKRMELTDFECGEYESSSGGGRFDKILLFATIGPAKAGWMTKPPADGWIMTDDGVKALQRFYKPTDIGKQELRSMLGCRVGAGDSQHMLKRIRAGRYSGGYGSCETDRMGWESPSGDRGGERVGGGVLPPRDV